MSYRYLNRVAGFLAAVILIAGCSARQPKPSAEPPTLSEAQRQANVESFDVAWETVRDTHWDPTFNGMDWQAVREELRPRVEQARTAQQFYTVMGEMIGRFQQSHFAIIPREKYAALMASSTEKESTPATPAPAPAPGEASAPIAAEDDGGSDGRTGLDVRMVDGQALVVAVEEDSPAAAAGVRTGWRILSVDGVVAELRVAKAGSAFHGKTMRPLIEHAALRRMLSGPTRSERTVVFENGEGQQVETVLTLAAPRGRPYRLGIMPGGHIWLESRRLDGNIGYIAFNAFMDPVRLAGQFEAAVREFADTEARGLVIDIRGNGGGIPLLVMGMAGWLIDRQGEYFGVMKTRDSELRFSVNPRTQTFGGPVAVLIDGSSASCAEIFPAGLRDMGRARLFGTRTAGAVLPAQFRELPNGDFFYYPIADYFSRNGDRLEGVGVMPDVHAPHTRSALLAGRDNALSAAVEWILNTGPKTTQEPAP